MIGINCEARTQDIFKLLSGKLNGFPTLGARKWGNPSGYHHESIIHEISSGENSVWVSTVAWSEASTDKINRYGLLSTLPTKNNYETLGQILEINLPIYFSKAFNTRMFEENDVVEIRNYGKFTVGRKGLRRKQFFDYLRDNGMADEIRIDEEGNEYILIFKIENFKIENEVFAQRIVETTLILQGFKEQFRKEN